MQIAITGTPRQITNQLAILVDPSEPFRPKCRWSYTGSKDDALWDARGHYWQFNDIHIALDAELCVNPLDAPRFLPLDWGLRP